MAILERGHTGLSLITGPASGPEDSLPLAFSMFFPTMRILIANTYSPYAVPDFVLNSLHTLTRSS